MQLVMEPTEAAQWHTLVSEAEAAAHTTLDETSESYLVFTLMRFTERPEMAASLVGLDFLESARQAGGQAREQLRDVGDKCLLFSGLFPQLARKRLVKVSYFVDVGRAAYGQLQSRTHQQVAELYGRLQADFVAMMDVLQAMREMGGDERLQLDAMGAMELCQDTSSRRAHTTLTRHTRSESPIIVRGMQIDIKH